MVSPHLPASCLPSWSASSKDPSLPLDSSTDISDQPFWAFPPAPCVLAPFPASRPSSSLSLWAVAKFWAASGLYFRTATCSSIILLQDHSTEPLVITGSNFMGVGSNVMPQGSWSTHMWQVCQYQHRTPCVSLSDCRVCQFDNLAWEQALKINAHHWKDTTDISTTEIAHKKSFICLHTKHWPHTHLQKHFRLWWRWKRGKELEAKSALGAQYFTSKLP